MTAVAKVDPMVPAAARVRGVVRETADTVTLTLDPPARSDAVLRFRPGQFNMLYAFGVGEVPISISGDPEEPERLVHTVRIVGAVTRRIGALRRGATLGVRGPFGTAWPVEEARGHDVVIVAGGLGLAPLRPAILSILAHRADFRQVSIVYGARRPEDILFRKDLEAWRGRFDTVVSVTVDRAGADWRGRVGPVTEALPRVRFDPAKAYAFVCGPEVMMRVVGREIEERRLPAGRIFVSLERNMKCGIGRCGHCQMGPLFACRDGPVLPLDKVAPWWARREA